MLDSSLTCELDGHRGGQDAARRFSPAPFFHSGQLEYSRWWVLRILRVSLAVDNLVFRIANLNIDFPVDKLCTGYFVV